MASGPNRPGPWPGVVSEALLEHSCVAQHGCLCATTAGQRPYGPQMLEYSLPLYRKGLPAPGVDDETIFRVVPDTRLFPEGCLWLPHLIGNVRTGVSCGSLFR